MMCHGVAHDIPRDDAPARVDALDHLAAAARVGLGRDEVAARQEENRAVADVAVPGGGMGEE